MVKKENANLLNKINEKEKRTLVKAKKKIKKKQISVNLM